MSWIIGDKKSLSQVEIKNGTSLSFTYNFKISLTKLKLIVSEMQKSTAIETIDPKKCSA